MQIVGFPMGQLNFRLYVSYLQEYLKHAGDPKWIDDIKKDLHRQFPLHEMFMARGGYGLVNVIRKDLVWEGWESRPYLSRLVGKPTMWFPNRSATNRPVQLTEAG